MVTKLAFIGNYSSIAFLYLLVLVLLIVLYLVSRKLIQRGRFTKKTNSNIEIIERFYISADKTLLIIRVGDEYLLLSYDKNGMNFLKTLEHFIPDQKAENKEKFQDLLNGVVKKDKSDEIQ